MDNLETICKSFDDIDWDDVHHRLDDTECLTSGSTHITNYSFTKISATKAYLVEYRHNDGTGLPPQLIYYDIPFALWILVQDEVEHGKRDIQMNIRTSLGL